MRSNTYKEKILEILEKNHLMAISDIQANISDSDFSTIFRNITQLCAEGVVRKITVDKNTTLYEMKTHENPHDHFVCDDCGYVDSVKVPKLSLRGKAFAKDVLVRGVCNDCVKE